MNFFIGFDFILIEEKIIVQMSSFEWPRTNILSLQSWYLPAGPKPKPFDNQVGYSKKYIYFLIEPHCLLFRGKQIF